MFICLLSFNCLYGWIGGYWGWGHFMGTGSPFYHVDSGARTQTWQQMPFFTEPLQQPEACFLDIWFHSTEFAFSVFNIVTINRHHPSLSIYRSDYSLKSSCDCQVDPHDAFVASQRQSQRNEKTESSEHISAHWGQTKWGCSARYWRQAPLCFYYSLSFSSVVLVDNYGFVFVFWYFCLFVCLFVDWTRSS